MSLQRRMSKLNLENKKQKYNSIYKLYASYAHDVDLKKLIS